LLQAPSWKITADMVSVAAPVPVVSQESGYDCWPGGRVSFCSTTVTDPHFTRRVKLAVTLPLFTTVTVTVTFWPTVAVPVGETVMALMVGAVNTPTGLTVTMTIVDRDNEELVPVTVTVYEPADVEVVVVTLSEALFVPPNDRVTTMLGPVNVEFSSERDRPVPRGETVAVTFTLPDSPKLSKAILEVEKPPATMFRLPGLALIRKSAVTVTPTNTE